MLPSVQNQNLALLEQKEHITKEEHEKLLDACIKHCEGKQRSGLYHEFIRDRNYMMMLTMWNTGARIGDICIFTDKTIDTYNKHAKFIVNKLSKKDSNGNIIKAVYHKVMLEDSFILAYHNYIKKWDINGYLFTSFKQHNLDITEQKPISTRQVNKFLVEYSNIAGLDRNVHAHLYRHGIGIHMLHSGVPLEIISKFLGHRSLETTIKFYAKITPEFAWRMIQDKMRVN